MEKDLVVKIIKNAKRLWREAKKPIIRTDIRAKISVLPEKDCDEDKHPKALISSKLDITLIYILLGFLALRYLCKMINAIFR